MKIKYNLKCSFSVARDTFQMLSGHIRQVAALIVRTQNGSMFAESADGQHRSRWHHRRGPGRGWRPLELCDPAILVQGQLTCA